MSDHEPDEQSPHQHEPQPRPSRQGSPGQSGPPSDVDAVHIPAPRLPLDDQLDIPASPPPDQPPDRQPRRSSDHSPDRWRHHGGVWPRNGLVEPEFRYDQTWKRGKRRHYNGFVERIGGAEGERLRQDLTAALRDLLDWAFRDANNGHDGHDRGDGGTEGEPGTGSGRDGDTR